jgi:hypothetical protein
LNEEYSESSREEEGKTEEPLREESITSGTAPTVEVIITNPLIVLATLSNQSSQSYQRTITNHSIHTQSRNLGISMADEMRLHIFRGDGSQDPDQHWLL